VRPRLVEKLFVDLFGDETIGQFVKVAKLEPFKLGKN
jgi:hypothetical protein